MKATELMIGDWVFYSKKAFPYQIKLLGENLCKLDGLDNSIELDEISPVNLTAEILEKNGFKVDPTINPFAVRLVVEMYSHGTTWKDEQDAMRGLRYVHELQHALRLCGIEKEVVL